MIKVSSILTLLLIFISIFSISTLVSFGEGRFGFNSGYIPPIIMMIIEVISIIIIAFFIKTFNFKGIQKITFIWIFLVLVTCVNITSDLDKVIVSVLFWPLVLLAFYIIFKNSTISIKFPLRIWLALAIISSLIVYQISNFINNLLFNDDVSATINYIFYPLLVTPWILLHNNKKINLAWLFLILSLSLYSVKRSAIIIIVLIAVIYISQTYFKNVNRNPLKKVFLIIILLFTSLQIFIFVDSLNNSYLFSRFVNVFEDKGSGRFDVYKSVIELQKNSDIANWIVGHGHDGVRKDNFVNSSSIGESRNLSAHNDMLEVLYDYGVFALFLYISFIILLIKRFFYLKKTKSPFFLAYTSSLIIFFIMSLGSHLILYPTYFIFLTSFWGAIEGLIERNKNVIHLEQNETK